MHGQEIFQVFTDLNHSDLGLCTGKFLPGFIIIVVMYESQPREFEELQT